MKLIYLGKGFKILGIFGNDIAASKGENVGQIFQLSIFFLYSSSWAVGDKTWIQRINKSLVSYFEIFLTQLVVPFKWRDTILLKDK